MPPTHTKTNNAHVYIAVIYIDSTLVYEVHEYDAAVEAVCLERPIDANLHRLVYCSSSYSTPNVRLIAKGFALLLVDVLCFGDPAVYVWFGIGGGRCFELYSSTAVRDSVRVDLWGRS